jgi:hypothetical protein
VSAKTVTRWASEGRLEHRRTLGGHRRFDPELIDALVLKDLHQVADLGRLTRIPRSTEQMWEPTGRHDKNAAGSERSPQESAVDGENGARTHARPLTASTSSSWSWSPSPTAGLAPAPRTTSTTERALPSSAVQVAVGVGPQPLGCRAVDESHFISIA